MNLKSVFVIALISLFGISSLDAQRKYDDDYEPSKKFVERVFVGTYLSSPFISGGVNGSVFGLGLQPFAAINLNEYFATGVTVKFDYTYFWQQGGNTNSFTDLSSTVFVRTTLLQRFIAQIDGGIYSNHRENSTGTGKERMNFPVLYAGLGYSFGNAEIILAYEVTGNIARYVGIPIEYKYGFIWNF